MYYHILIETTEKIGNVNKRYFDFDKNTIEEIKNEYIIPYLLKKELHIDGYFLNNNAIKRISIKETENNINSMVELISKDAEFYFPNKEEVLVGYDEYCKDITKIVFENANAKIEVDGEYIQNEVIYDNKKVFIVHGHDDLAKNEVARFIEKLELEPIILHEQANGGKTIIEKIEDYSNVAFGIIIYTPCDVGAKVSDTQNLQPRARQNVVFEHGFLNGKLGRHNVCALVKSNLEKPNDISGLVYVDMDNAGAWKMSLAKDLKESNYSVDMNKVL